MYTMPLLFKYLFDLAKTRMNNVLLERRSVFYVFYQVVLRNEGTIEKYMHTYTHIHRIFEMIRFI